MTTMMPVKTRILWRRRRPRRGASVDGGESGGPPRREGAVPDFGARLDGAVPDFGARLDGAVPDDGARLDGALAEEGGESSDVGAEDGGDAPPPGSDGGFVRRFGGLRSGFERLIRWTSWHPAQPADSHATALRAAQATG